MPIFQISNILVRYFVFKDLKFEFSPLQRVNSKKKEGENLNIYNVNSNFWVEFNTVKLTSDQTSFSLHTTLHLGTNDYHTKCSD